MLIQNAIKSVYSIPDSWVRVQQVRRTFGGIEVCFSVHKGRRGRTIEGWDITCRGVHEAEIRDLDGGGLATYPSTHPAARQYAARQAELRWRGTCDETQALAALFRAHAEEVDDWIPFDRYLLVNTFPWSANSYLPDFAPVSGSKFVCRGPDFLLRAYANALEAIGERVQLTRRGKAKAKSIRPRVLHFGASFIVADEFEAERLEL